MPCYRLLQLLKTSETARKNEMISYIIENKEQLFGVVTAIIAAASAIAALTPTPKDDTFIGKAYKVIDWLALNVLKAKDK